MKKNLLLLLFVALMGHISFAQVKWSVDPAHTNARFQVKHLGIAFVDGEFKELEGSVETLNTTDFNNAKVNFKINANSIDTRVEARNDHLKSDDFFNTEKYPYLTLSNAVLTKSENNKYVLNGDLTIRDVTKSVSFDVNQNNGIITDPWGGTRAGFTAKTTIDRTDFNVNYEDKLPSGIDAVAKNVDIVINVEVVQQ